MGNIIIIDFNDWFCYVYFLLFYKNITSTEKELFKIYTRKNQNVLIRKKKRRNGRRGVEEGYKRCIRGV